MSARKAWLLLLSSFIDEVVMLALIILALWYFHVEITWLIILVIVMFIIIFAIIMHFAVVPALRRSIVTGVEGMIGATGKVIETLNPEGTVDIKGEYWKAVSADGKIETEKNVEVVDIHGLMLKVKESD